MKRRTVIIAAAAVVVLAGGISGVVLATSGSGGAESVAQRYAEALGTGDVEAVRGLITDPEAISDAAWSAFADAQGYLEGLNVSQIEESGDRAEATLSSDPNGDGEAYSITLEKSAAGWRVTDAARPVTISSTVGPGVRISGTEMRFDDGAESLTTALLPGTYTISAAPSGVFQGSDETTITPDGDPEPIALTPSFAVGIDRSVTQALAQHLEACAGTFDQLPEQCGLLVPWPMDMASATGFTVTVGTLPNINVNPTAGTFRASGGSVTIGVDGLREDGSTIHEDYHTDNWTLRGAVAVSDEGLELQIY